VSPIASTMLSNTRPRPGGCTASEAEAASTITSYSALIA
jgi:hypothetical protein